jgi:hypothetical protein
MPSSVTNSLYLLRLKAMQAAVGMPNRGASASVDCFVAAPDATAAGSEAVHRLNLEGFLIGDCDAIQKLDPALWSAFVRERYPTTFPQLPSEPDIAKLVEEGGVLLGPFSAWEREA